VPYITIATEDELSEAVGLRLVADILPRFEVTNMLRRGGNGYLKRKCLDFRAFFEPSESKGDSHRP
jgi:hypothetical protein